MWPIVPETRHGYLRKAKCPVDKGLGVRAARGKRILSSQYLLLSVGATGEELRRTNALPLLANRPWSQRWPWSRFAPGCQTMTDAGHWLIRLFEHLVNIAIQHHPARRRLRTPIISCPTRRNVDRVLFAHRRLSQDRRAHRGLVGCREAIYRKSEDIGDHLAPQRTARTPSRHHDPFRHRATITFFW